MVGYDCIVEYIVGIENFCVDFFFWIDYLLLIDDFDICIEMGLDVSDKIYEIGIFDFFNFWFKDYMDFIIEDKDLDIFDKEEVFFNLDLVVE